MPRYNLHESQCEGWVFEDHGCGCCGGFDPITYEDLKNYITELETELALARTLLPQWVPDEPVSP